MQNSSCIGQHECEVIHTYLRQRQTETDRDRDRDRETDRQTADRQTDRQIDRQTDRQTDRQRVQRCMKIDEIKICKNDPAKRK